MFAKILKYDFVEFGLASLVGLIFGAAVAIGSTFLVFTGQEMLVGLGTTVGFLAALIVPAVIFILNAMRYYQSVYGGRGYFTNTLAVGGGVILGAKTLWLYLVSLACTLFAIISFEWMVACQNIMHDAQGWDYGERIAKAWESISSVLGYIPGYMYGMLLVVFLFTSLQWVIWTVASSALGNRFAFARIAEKKAVWLGAIICFAIYQAVSLAAIFAIPASLHLTGMDDNVSINFTTGIITSAMTTNDSGTHIPLGTLVQIPLLMLGYWFAHNSLTRHLSLR